MCSYAGCDHKGPYKRGYCGMHYQRLKKHGDPSKTLIRYSGRHGMTHTPTWYSWIAMIERATSDNHRQYEDYKGRGITVCDRWNKSFVSFLDDMGLRPAGKTLDRIDNDKGYSPDNCKWSTYVEQNNNRRSKWVKYPTGKKI